MSDLFNGEPFRLIIDEDDPKDIKFGNSGLGDAKYVRTLSFNKASFKIVYRSSESPITINGQDYYPLRIYFKYNDSDQWQLVYTHPWIAIDNYSGEGVEVETIDSIEEPIDGTIYKPAGPSFETVKGYAHFYVAYDDPLNVKNQHLNDARIYYNNYISSYFKYISAGSLNNKTIPIAYMYKKIENNILSLKEVQQLFGTAGLEQLKYYHDYDPTYRHIYRIKYTKELYDNSSKIKMYLDAENYNIINLSEPEHINTYKLENLNYIPTGFRELYRSTHPVISWNESPVDVLNPYEEPVNTVFYAAFVHVGGWKDDVENPNIDYIYRGPNSTYWHYNGSYWEEVNEFRLWYYSDNTWKTVDIPNCLYFASCLENNERRLCYIIYDVNMYGSNYQLQMINVPTENSYDDYITDENILLGNEYLYPKFKLTTNIITEDKSYNEVELIDLNVDKIYYITFPDVPSYLVSRTKSSSGDGKYFGYPLRKCDSYFKGMVTTAVMWKLKNSIQFNILESDYSYIWSKKYELNFHHTNDTTITKSYKFYIVVDSLTRNDEKFTIDLSDDNRYIELLNTQTTLRNELYLPVDTIYSVHVELPNELLYTYKLVGISGWSGTANSSSADVNSKIHYNFTLTYAYDPIYVDLNLVNNTNIHYIKRSTDNETIARTSTTSQSYQLDFRCSESYYDYRVRSRTTTQGYYNKIMLKRLQYGTTYSKDMVLYESAKLSISDESYASFEDAEILLDTSFTLDAQEESIYLLYTNATSVILSKNDNEFTLTLEQTSVLLYSDAQYDAYLYCYAIIENNYITGLRFFLDAEQYHHTDSYDICIPNAFGAIPGEHWVLTNSIIRPEPETLPVAYITVDPYNTDISINLSTDNKDKAVELNVTIGEYSKIFTVYNDTDSQYHIIYTDNYDNKLYYYVECDKDGFLTTLHFYGIFDDDQGVFTFEPIISIR